MGGSTNVMLPMSKSLKAKETPIQAIKIFELELTNRQIGSVAIKTH
tara:strand:+ start:7826 stop:7963 length:138 start_codon:yes stop_codon:yes gene_type:complete